MSNIDLLTNAAFCVYVCGLLYALWREVRYEKRRKTKKTWGWFIRRKL